MNISNGVDKQIIVKNLLISYSEMQGGGGRTLLFLHGWRSNKEVWQKVIKSISDDKYQIFVLDLPGFGGSQIPKQPMTVGDYVDVVEEFIKKLDLKNVIIVGHSFGGRVGIKLAAKYPTLVEKLVLVDSAGFAMSSSRKVLYRSLAKIVKPVFQPKFMQPLRKKIYQKIGAEDYVATPEMQKTFVNITGEDLSADMKNIKCPTLIIWGEDDTDTPLRYLHQMTSLIPNNKYQTLSGAGHYSFLDKPEEFAKVIEEFIS